MTEVKTERIARQEPAPDDFSATMDLPASANRGANAVSGDLRRCRARSRAREATSASVALLRPHRSPSNSGTEAACAHDRGWRSDLTLAGK